MQLHDLVWIVGCAFQQQETTNVILMINIIVTNMLTRAPKSHFCQQMGQNRKNALKRPTLGFWQSFTTLSLDPAIRCIYILIKEINT